MTTSNEFSPFGFTTWFGAFFFSNPILQSDLVEPRSLSELSGIYVFLCQATPRLQTQHHAVVRINEGERGDERERVGKGEGGCPYEGGWRWFAVNGVNFLCFAYLSHDTAVFLKRFRCVIILVLHWLRMIWFVNRSWMVTVVSLRWMFHCGKMIRSAWQQRMLKIGRDSHG